MNAVDHGRLQVSVVGGQCGAKARAQGAREICVDQMPALVYRKQRRTVGI